eukprot:scaffold196555_cov44-Attheya_sp.AAC.2
MAVVLSDRSEVCKRGACRTLKKEHISLGGGERTPHAPVQFSGTSNPSSSPLLTLLISSSPPIAGEWVDLGLA